MRALQAVQAWTAELPTQKWTALGVGEGDRAELVQFAEAQGLNGVSILLDFELYQTRQWGVSHLPSLYLVSGKTGRVLHKILGEDAPALDGMKQMLTDEVNKIVAAEAAAKKAEEEKKAAEAPPKPPSGKAVGSTQTRPPKRPLPPAGQKKSRRSNPKALRRPPSRILEPREAKIRRSHFT